MGKLEARNPEFYKDASKEVNVGHYDYDLIVEHLKEKTHPNSVPSFILKVEEKKFMDPVIDPRETWSAFFKRILEFEDPPLVFLFLFQVEREELPPNLQPQNRAMGKISMYLEGVNDIHSDSKNQSVMEQRKLTNQEISMELSKSNLVSLPSDPKDIEMMIEERKE